MVPKTNLKPNYLLTLLCDSIASSYISDSSDSCDKSDSSDSSKKLFKKNGDKTHSLKL